MTNTQQASLSLDNERIVFNGHTHYAARVKAAVGASTAKLYIDLDQIQLDAPSAEELSKGVAIHLAKVEPTSDILDDAVEIGVYKHNNRFYVLTGKERIKYQRDLGKTKVTAKLVTSHALKAARVPAPTPVVSHTAFNQANPPSSYNPNRPVASNPSYPANRPQGSSAYQGVRPAGNPYNSDRPRNPPRTTHSYGGTVPGGGGREVFGYVKPK